MIETKTKQLRPRLILRLINGISRILERLLIYFNGTIISTSFLQLAPVWPVFLALDLKDVA